MADIDLTAADGHRFTAYRADPSAPPVGGVVVVQEIFGVNDHIRQVVDQYAEAGFVAVAPALFDRFGAGIELGYDAEGVERGQNLSWEQLPLAQALADLAAAAGALADELGGAQRVGTVGYCYGGMLAATLASRSPGSIAAAVAYYPSRAAQLLTDDVPGAPLIVHLGEQDQGVTPDDGRTLMARWPEATFHRYETAGHGFNCDQRPGFDPEAAALALSRSIAFLTDHLAAGVSEEG
ncbi:dienelactone hydrolase family protein [soil metagenome]